MNETQSNTRREDYPYETPSAYELRINPRYPTSYKLLVDSGQCLTIQRFGLVGKGKAYQEVEKFLDGKSQFSSVKDLYWGLLKLRGYV